METLSIQLVDISQKAPKVFVNKWTIVPILGIVVLILFWWLYQNYSENTETST